VIPRTSKRHEAVSCIWFRFESKDANLYIMFTTDILKAGGNDAREKEIIISRNLTIPLWSPEARTGELLSKYNAVNGIPLNEQSFSLWIEMEETNHKKLNK